MSFDRQLRESLDRAVPEVVPGAADRSLSGVVHRGRRRRRLRGAAGASAAALAIAGAVALLASAGGLLGRDAGTRPGAPDGPFALVAGSYTATLSGSDPDVARHGLAGNWILDLSTDGVMYLSPPVSFDASVTGIAFELDDDVLRTNAFSSGPTGCGAEAGTYRWSIAEDGLTLTPLDEPCALRASLFGRTWRHV
jgi:hypothetical protein